MQDENLKKEPSEKKEARESREFIYLELDRRREFKFGMKGLKLLEGEFPTEDPETHEKKPTPFLELFTIFAQKFRRAKLSVDDLVTIVWAGLIKDDPSITKDQTFELLENSRYDFAHIHELIEDIFGGFGASTPESKETDEKKSPGVTLTTVSERRKKRRGTGNKSSK